MRFAVAVAVAAAFAAFAAFAAAPGTQLAEAGEGSAPAVIEIDYSVTGRGTLGLGGNYSWVQGVVVQDRHGGRTTAKATLWQMDAGWRLDVGLPQGFELGKYVVVAKGRTAGGKELKDTIATLRVFRAEPAVPGVPTIAIDYSKTGRGSTVLQGDFAWVQRVFVQHARGGVVKGPKAGVRLANERWQLDVGLPQDFRLGTYRVMGFGKRSKKGVTNKPRLLANLRVFRPGPPPLLEIDLSKGRRVQARLDGDLSWVEQVAVRAPRGGLLKGARAALGEIEGGTRLDVVLPPGASTGAFAVYGLGALKSAGKRREQLLAYLRALRSVVLPPR